jgi:hypothetical protein
MGRGRLTEGDLASESLVSFPGLHERRLKPCDSQIKDQQGQQERGYEGKHYGLFVCQNGYS